MARWKGDDAEARQAEALLAKARAAVEKWFVPGKDVFASAELKDGTRYEANSAWQGMLLAEGGIDPGLARRAAASLASSKLMTPWGARLFATDSPYYDPLSYNDGSVWPFVTSQVLLALLRHGQAPAAMSVLDGMRQATGLGGAGFLAEYFSGGRLALGPRAVPHQLFSSVALIHPVFAWLLGLRPGAIAARLDVAPQLPCGGAPVALRRCRVGDAWLDADFYPGMPNRVHVRVRSGKLAVEVQPGNCFQAPPLRRLSPGMLP